MSDYEIKETVLGFHPEHGELIAASEAKEAIAHFNDIAKAELAKAKEDYKTLFSAFESCQDELKESNERVKELERQLNQSKKINALIDECYLIRKSPTVGDLSIFMCAPVVCCGEKSSLTLYQEWAVYIDEQLRKEQE